jgi:mRNA interferase RelE/StbE
VDPRPPGVKRLHGRREYLRLRSGDYRAIYTVDDDRFTVLIIKLGHRREVYRTL